MATPVWQKKADLILLLVYFGETGSTSIKVRIGKWGDSLAIRIPSEFADALNLDVGMRLQIAREGDALILKRPTYHYTLEQLLRNVTAQNIHVETDWGPAVGGETL